MPLLAPLLVGLLAGVNPFLAPTLKARLPDVPRQDVTAPRVRVVLEAALVAAVVFALVGAVAYQAVAFVSARLTYGVLIVGVIALLAGLHAWQPLSGRDRGDGDDDPPGTRFQWLKQYAGDALWYAAPAWVLALAAAMRGLTLAEFAAPFAAAWAGVAAATWLWGVVAPDKLPAAPPRKGVPASRGQRVLAVLYALAAVPLFLAYAGWL